MQPSDDDTLLRPIFENGRFVCPWKRWQQPNVWSLLKWKFATPNNNNIPATSEELDRTLPIKRTDYSKLCQSPKDRIQMLWLGHASVIVQFDGFTVLADPVFSDRIGPGYVTNIPLIGRLARGRYRTTPCTVQQLRKAGVDIDAVIISHNHFDHLDVPSVQELNLHYPGLKWFVPKGLKNWCVDTGCKKDSVEELSWWESGNLIHGTKALKFVCSPAQHWSRRSIFDENKSLWCSWTMLGPSKKVFFAGDTGYYRKAFQQIGSKYGPFDLALIPIGCYEPRCITEYQHCDVLEAVKIHCDLKAACSVGIHWGTFELTNEHYLEPREKLAEEAKNQGLGKNEFITLDHGEAWVVGQERNE